MATGRPAPQGAYVLHRYDWSETSLILDLFTREAGRVAVAAKGAKRPYSQLRGVLLPFQRLLVSYGTRRGDSESDIVTLKTAEWAGGGAMLSGAALFSGFYLNELLMKLLARHDPHPLVFDAYAHTLRSLAGGDELQAQAALRAFELLLLRALGLLPALDRVTLTQAPLQPGMPYALRAEGGVMPAADDEPLLSTEGLQALEAALERQALGALQSACLSHLPALKVQLRHSLHYHLGHQDLRTRRVMHDGVSGLSMDPTRA